MTEQQTEKTYTVTEGLLTMALTNARTSFQNINIELEQLQDDGLGESADVRALMMGATVVEEQIENLSDILGYNDGPTIGILVGV